MVVVLAVHPPDVIPPWTGISVVGAFVTTSMFAWIYEHVRRDHEAELRRLSQVDELTGAWRRGMLEQVLVTELARLRRHGAPCTVIALDVDDLKRVNDTLGHVAGDALLRRVAHVVRQNLRTTDVLVRTGGDEFVVVCRDTPLLRADGRASDAVCLIERLRQRLSEPVEGAPWRASVSIGAASALPGDTPASVVARADAALYRSKRAVKCRRCTTACDARHDTRPDGASPPACGNHPQRAHQSAVGHIGPIRSDFD